MSLWEEYAPQYGFVLLLVIWLALTVHFRRRREKRLASGWSVQDQNGVLWRIVAFLYSRSVWMFLGGFAATYYRVSPWVFVALALILSFVQTLIPNERWTLPSAAVEPSTHPKNENSQETAG